MTEDDFKSPKWIELKVDANVAHSRASALASLAGTSIGLCSVLAFVTVALIVEDGFRTNVIWWALSAVVFLVCSGVCLVYMVKYRRQGKDLQRQSWEASPTYHRLNDE